MLEAYIHPAKSLAKSLHDTALCTTSSGDPRASCDCACLDADGSHDGGVHDGHDVDRGDDANDDAGAGDEMDDGADDGDNFGVGDGDAADDDDHAGMMVLVMISTSIHRSSMMGTSTTLPSQLQRYS